MRNIVYKIGAPSGNARHSHANRRQQRQDGSAFYYAAGWLVRPAERNWWHNGSLPGTSSLIVRAGNGLAWAVLFNARSMVPGSTFEQEIDPAIWQAVAQVTSWPSHDFFDRYPDGSPRQYCSVGWWHGQG